MRARQSLPLLWLKGHRRAIKSSGDTESNNMDRSEFKRLFDRGLETAASNVEGSYSVRGRLKISEPGLSVAVADG